MLISGEITQKTYDDVHASLASGNREFTLSSPGGSVYAGLGIYDMFKAAGDVKIELNGIVASIASIVMLGASEIIATENSRVMVHLPTLGVQGNVEDLTNAAAELQELEDVMLAIYAPFGFDREALKKETYLSAAQAKKAGLIHIIKSLKTEPMANHKTIIEQLKATLGMSPKALMVTIDGAEVEVMGDELVVGAAIDLADGTYQLEGMDTTIIVADGVITEVITQEQIDEINREESALAELTARFDALEANHTALSEAHAKLTGEYNELKAVAEMTIAGFKPEAKKKNFTPTGTVDRAGRFEKARAQARAAKGAKA